MLCDWFVVSQATPRPDRPRHHGPARAVQSRGPHVDVSPTVGARLPPPVVLRPRVGPPVAGEDLRGLSDKRACRRPAPPVRRRAPAVGEMVDRARVGRVTGNSATVAGFRVFSMKSVSRSPNQAIDTAFFSAANISRRFLAGLASDLLSAAAAAFVGGEEERREVERAFGADVPRICSTSVNALISAWRRSISLWRLAIACAISFMALESSDPAMGMSTRGGGRRVCHGAPATVAQPRSDSRRAAARTPRA